MWSEERIALASDLWRGGETASAIAERLGHGATRNAVIGKLTRIGVTREAPRRASKPSVTARAVRERRAAARQEKKAVLKPEPITPLNVPFLDIEFGQCRAITDSTRDAQRCCGHPVDERGTYCAAHRAIFYTRSQGKSA